MSNGNILIENFVKLGVNSKQKSKRIKSSVKSARKSLIKNELRRITKSDATQQPDDLAKFQTFQLERTSTPNHFNLCEHCKHSHAKECCLYIYDDHTDIMKYSSFKHDVEEPYYIVDNDENFHMKIGRTTPKCFPTFTENDSSLADMKTQSNVGQAPILYLQHYLWPVYVPQYHPPLPNDQFVQSPHNFGYFAPMNIPQHININQIPSQPYFTNLNYKQYYNPHPIECNNYVPMNFNNFWV